MSEPGPSPWRRVHAALSHALFLLVALPCLTTGKQGNCTHPLVPEHGGFRCEPSPCRGFPQRSVVFYFCEPGFSLPERLHSSHCHYGRWIPGAPSCVPARDQRPKNEEKLFQELPSVATTAVGVSIFLLTTTACMVIKSRLYPCQSNRRSSDQMDLVVDGLPVALPTYEEAVYGSWGQRLPPQCGPTQLLLSQEALTCDQREPSNCTQLLDQSPELPPPPYEENQSRVRTGGMAGDDKDV